MFRRAQDRIRTYYYKTKDELLKSKDLPPSKLTYLLNDLQSRLKTVKYFGCYFDRSSSYSLLGADGEGHQLQSICDERGEFSCQGRWDKEMCLYTPVHKINPYTSREERIIFQTWNLDHLKERSRAIIPAICAALREEGDLNIDVKSIFSDLFTMKNLKFVHIVCHDKGAHFSKTAGPYLLY